MTIWHMFKCTSTLELAQGNTGIGIGDHAAEQGAAESVWK